MSTLLRNSNRTTPLQLDGPLAYCGINTKWKSFNEVNLQQSSLKHTTACNCWRVCTQKAEHENAAPYPFSGSKNTFFTNLSDFSITKEGNLYVLAEDGVSRFWFPFLAHRTTKKTRRLPLTEEQNPNLPCQPISYPGPERFSTHRVSTGLKVWQVFNALLHDFRSDPILLKFAFWQHQGQGLCNNFDEMLRRQRALSFYLWRSGSVIGMV